jgi:tetratricopeptide (TPR) repeat protein
LSRSHKGDHSAAIADFAAVVRRRPDLVAGYLNRGLAYAAAGYPRAAISDFTTAIERGHAPTRVFFLRARSWQAVGEAERAAEDVRAGLTRTPNDALSWIARGMVRLPRDPHGAWSDFRAAHRLDPTDRTALRNIAHVTADRLDQPAEALDALDALLALDPQDDAAAAGRAVALARLGRAAEAREATRVLLTRSPPPIVVLQAACVYSLTSRDEPADAQRGLDLLRSALEADATLVRRARTDADLAPLRVHPGFAAAVASATPPASSPPPSPVQASSASLR